MFITAGSKSRCLASAICRASNIQYIPNTLNRFQDSEVQIEILAKVSDSIFFVLQSTDINVNESFMELLMLINTLYKANAKQVIAIVPYFGYSRQDAQNDSDTHHKSSMAILAPEMIKTAGANQIITLDLHNRPNLHNEQKRLISSSPSIPIINLYAAQAFLPYILTITAKHKECIIVSPDFGGRSRALEISTLLNLPCVFLDKTRTNDNLTIIHSMAKSCIDTNNIKNNIDIKNKYCILIDDIIDSGRTACASAMYLINTHKASGVSLFATHALLSCNAQSLLESSLIEKIYVTNTLERSFASERFQVVDIKDVLISAIYDSV